MSILIPINFTVMVIPAPGKRSGIVRGTGRNEVSMNKRYLRSLTDLAGRLGLKLDSQSETIFGSHNGYSVSLNPISDGRQFIFGLSVSDAAGQLPDPGVLKKAVSSSKAVASCKVQGHRVNYFVRQGMTKKKSESNLQQALDDVTNHMRLNGLENSCQSCGTAGETSVYNISGTGTILCDHCFSERSEAAASKDIEQSRKKENVIAGFVGALLGSLLGAAVIILMGQLGYVAVLSGLVLGVCTLKGYELLGGRMSVKGIVISIVLMIVMVYAGNRMDWAISAASYFEDLDVMTAFRWLPDLIREDYMDGDSYYGSLAMVYLFTAVGAVPTMITMLRADRQANMSYKMSGM